MIYVHKCTFMFGSHVKWLKPNKRRFSKGRRMGGGFFADDRLLKGRPLGVYNVFDGLELNAGHDVEIQYAIHDTAIYL